MISLAHYLTVAAILFTIGVLGIFLNRRNVILMLMAIEPRRRKKITRMARPIAASAAATVNTNIAST